MAIFPKNNEAKYLLTCTAIKNSVLLENCKTCDYFNETKLVINKQMVICAWEHERKMIEISEAKKAEKKTPK
jgi:hypothetical protein